MKRKKKKNQSYEEINIQLKQIRINFNLEKKSNIMDAIINAKREIDKCYFNFHPSFDSIITRYKQINKSEIFIQNIIVIIIAVISSFLYTSLEYFGDFISSKTDSSVLLTIVLMIIIKVAIMIVSIIIMCLIVFALVKNISHIITNDYDTFVQPYELEKLEGIISIQTQIKNDCLKVKVMQKQ